MQRRVRKGAYTVSSQVYSIWCRRVLRAAIRSSAYRSHARDASTQTHCHPPPLRRQFALVAGAFRGCCALRLRRTRKARRSKVDAARAARCTSSRYLQGGRFASGSPFPSHITLDLHVRYRTSPVSAVRKPFAFGCSSARTWSAFHCFTEAPF